VWFDLSRPRADLRLAGLGVDEFETDFVTASFDLRLDLMETGFGPLAGQLVYATDLFDADTVAAFARRYLALLRAVAEQPGVRLADLDILTAGERAQVLTGWAGPVAAPRSSQTLARRFEDQAARRPDAAAVSFGPQHVSYRELNERANRLAALLRERGVGDEVVVGLLLPRGITLAVAVLAVIKAGGAYLPLSVDFPPERISLMITDSGAAITLTESAHAERLARGMPAVVLDACQADLDRFPAGNQDGCTGIDNLLYVMYTSGSTGVPKGVAMPQRPLLNLMDWHLRRYAGGPVLQFSTTTFDMSFQEMFLPWLTGGALVPVTDDERLDPEALLAIMRRAEVGTLICPPVLLHHIASHVESAAAEVALPPLREIVAAGEELRLTPAILALVTRLQPVTLDNQYGPTETHCSASLRLSGDPATWPPVVPLGQPLTGKQLLLLDDQLRPVPAGVPGELYIGGDALARGYFGKPDLTAERFLPHPYPGSPGERLYRTGDRARWRPGGVLEFLGRADDQIKIRGCRVEPGEVEALLRRSAAVAAAAVLPVTVSGQTELAAYLVLTAELAGDARRAAVAQLRARLKETLPDYLVPGYFVTLSELPLTSVGKLDRTALPSPLAGESGHGEFVAPRNPQEAVIVAIWSEALGRPSVSATADFFELGGHSLLATKVRSRIRSAFGVDLPLRALFDHRTVPALALAVEDAMAADIAAMSSAEVAAAIRDGGP
jgi:amino acid adenylation domain-containing protein